MSEGQEGFAKDTVCLKMIQNIDMIQYIKN